MLWNSKTKILFAQSNYMYLEYALEYGTSFVDILCFFYLVFAMPLYASVYMCLVVNCWERADLLALVCGVLL